MDPPMTNVRPKTALRWEMCPKVVEVRDPNLGRQGLARNMASPTTVLLGFQNTLNMLIACWDAGMSLTMAVTKSNYISMP